MSISNLDLIVGNNSMTGMKGKIAKFSPIQWVGILLSIGSILSIIASIIFFMKTFLNTDFIFNQIIFSLVTLIVALLLFNLPTFKPVSSAERSRQLAKISIIITGTFWGIVIFFFVVGSSIITLSGRPIPGGLIGNVFLGLTITLGGFIGAIVGYFFFKKSKYSKLSHYNPFYED